MSKLVLHIAEAAGGVERYLVSLLTKLSNCSDYVHILVCSNTYHINKFSGLVKEVIVIDTLHNSISLSNDLKSILYIRKIIKKYKPDIVYCHSSKAGAVGRIANIGIANKVIYNAHGWAFNMLNVGNCKILLYELIEKMLAILTHKIICISEYEKKSCLEHAICKQNKLLVINNGIDFLDFSNLNNISRKELDIPESAFVVGLIGRIAPQKAPDVFVKMAFEIKKTIPNAFFIIVGDDVSGGQNRINLETQICKAGLVDSFVITGWVDNPYEYISVFDVAVLLSRWEGFGLVLLEYMYMCKPIVATRIDAIPYVVGDAGQLVEVDDYLSAAISVRRYYENEEYKTQMIHKGQARVRLFDVQKTADEHIKLFSELCK